ncbi:MAG: DUF4276 family protein [Planctomycetota bacterium]|nr:DUF4276 family protein [Planctomycetota bacterium]
MVEVKFLVEGDTEETFVNRVLRSHFFPLGINPHPQKLGKPGHYSGIVEYPRARDEILTTLKQDKVSFCTTMVDYYAMPSSWPGRQTAAGNPVPIELAIRADISAEMGRDFNPVRFLPYVQMHEFEALLFSDPEVLASHLGLADESQIQEIRDQFANPEEIDDDPQTAPSKRISRLDRSYQKPYDGMLIAQHIGLDTMRAECPHFNEWLRKLEALVG